MADLRIPPGAGIYTQADVARLLDIHPRRLSRWVHGYTYYIESESARRRRRQGPLIHRGDLPQVNGARALSFLEVWELRVVKALLEYPSVSLQKIRRAATIAGELFDTDKPFATQRIFTDGRGLFVALREDVEIASDMIELADDRHAQIIAGDLVEPFLEEVDFDDRTTLARRWWPLTKNFPVVLDPEILFGAPVIEGTRIRTNVLKEFSRYEPESELAKAYRLDRAQVRAALRFERMLAA